MNEYKYEIERLNRELADIKRRYYEKKRREQQERDRAMDGGSSMGSQKAGASAGFQPRFTGGGFSLAS